MLGLSQILASKLVQTRDTGLGHFSEPGAIQGLKMAPPAPQNPLEAFTTDSREGPISFKGVILNTVLKT